MSAANDNTGELAWSIPDAAQAMGISKATVWRHIAAGKHHDIQNRVPNTYPGRCLEGFCRSPLQRRLMG